MTDFDFADPRHEYLHGQCAAWAVAFAVRHPHLRFGLHWEKLTDAERDKLIVEDGWGEDDAPTHQVQHVFCHDDDHAYDAAGIHPLPFEKWDRTSLDHDLADVEATGMHEPGYQPDSDFFDRYGPHIP